MQVTENRTIEINGVDRPYRLLRPSSTAGAKKSLNIMSGGGFSSIATFAPKVAEFTDAYPNEYHVILEPDDSNHYNSGGQFGEGTKDLDYVDGIINLLLSQFNKIDAQQINLTGHSNGGMLFLRYAATSGRPLNSLLGLATALTATETLDFSGVGKLRWIHGEQDQNIPYLGGQGTGGTGLYTFDPVEESFAAINATAPDAELIFIQSEHSLDSIKAGLAPFTLKGVMANMAGL